VHTGSASEKTWSPVACRNLSISPVHAWCAHYSCTSFKICSTERMWSLTVYCYWVRKSVCNSEQPNAAMIVRLLKTYIALHSTCNSWFFLAPELVVCVGWTLAAYASNDHDVGSLLCPASPSSKWSQTASNTSAVKSNLCTYSKSHSSKCRTTSDTDLSSFAVSSLNHSCIICCWSTPDTVSCIGFQGFLLDYATLLCISSWAIISCCCCCCCLDFGP